MEYEISADWFEQGKSQAKRFNGEKEVILPGLTRLHCASQVDAQLLCDVINRLCTVVETPERK